MQFLFFWTSSKESEANFEKKNSGLLKLFKWTSVSYYFLKWVFCIWWTSKIHHMWTSFYKKANLFLVGNEFDYFYKKWTFVMRRSEHLILSSPNFSKLILLDASKWTLFTVKRELPKKYTPNALWYELLICTNWTPASWRLNFQRIPWIVKYL